MSFQTISLILFRPSASIGLKIVLIVLAPYEARLLLIMFEIFKLINIVNYNRLIC